MLTEFPGGVWIEPSEIIGLVAQEITGLEPCEYAKVGIVLRNGQITMYLTDGPAIENHKKRYNAAEAWIRNYLAEAKARFCDWCGQHLASNPTGEFPCAKCGKPREHDPVEGPDVHGMMG